MEKTYYQILGVKSTASSKDLTQALKEKIKHTQLTYDGNPEIIQEKIDFLLDIYNILLHEDSRKEYDTQLRLKQLATFEQTEAAIFDQRLDMYVLMKNPARIHVKKDDESVLLTGYFIAKEDMETFFPSSTNNVMKVKVPKRIKNNK